MKSFSEDTHHLDLNISGLFLFVCLFSFLFVLHEVSSQFFNLKTLENKQRTSPTEFCGQEVLTSLEILDALGFLYFL